MLLPTLKSTILRIINQHENSIALFLPQINLEFTRGGQGGQPPQTQNEFFLKKSNKMEAFPYYFFFCFLAGLPRSPKLLAFSLAPFK